MLLEKLELLRSWTPSGGICLPIHARTCGVCAPRQDYCNLGHRNPGHRNSGDGRACECAFETTGVFACGNAEDPQKTAPHRIYRFEAAGIGNLFESARGAVDDLLRRFDAHTVNELARVHSSLTQADAREVASAHTNALGERFDGKVFAKVLQHPYLKLAQWLRGDSLMREHVAVLRLSARTHKEHDKEARNLESCFVSVIFLDQGEREVNAGSDPCRRVNGAVAQIDRLGPHNNVWVFPGETVAEVPVRNRLLSIEKTCFCKKKCAGADRCDAA